VWTDDQGPAQPPLSAGRARRGQGAWAARGEAAPAACWCSLSSPGPLRMATNSSSPYCLRSTVRSSRPAGECARARMHGRFALLPSCLLAAALARCCTQAACSPIIRTNGWVWQPWSASAGSHADFCRRFLSSRRAPGLLLVGLLDGSIAGIDSQDGSIRWTYDTGPPLVSGRACGRAGPGPCLSPSGSLYSSCAHSSGGAACMP